MISRSRCLSHFLPRITYQQLRTARMCVALLACVPACGRRSTQVEPSLEALQRPGTLPSGCTLVVTLDPVALEPLMTALQPALNGRGMADVHSAGIDPRRDLRRITYCRLPGDAVTKSGFVMLFSGAVPTDAVGTMVASSKRGLSSDLAMGILVAGRPGLWVARRGGTGATAATGELLMAHDRQALRAALFGPPGNNRLDATASFALVMSADELRRSAPAQAELSSAEWSVVREINLTLRPGARVLTIRFLVGDQAAAQVLAGQLRPVLSQFASAITGRPSAKLEASVESGDVAATVDLPPGILDTFAAHLRSSRSMVR